MATREGTGAIRQQESERPGAMTVVFALTVFLTYRALAITMIGGIGQADGPPESWFVPMAVDVFVGVTAAVTAVLLWRRTTLSTWLIAIVFHTVALSDILRSIINAIRVPWTESFMGDLMLPGLGVGVVISVAALYLLGQPAVRRHYDDKNLH